MLSFLFLFVLHFISTCSFRSIIQFRCRISSLKNSIPNLFLLWAFFTKFNILILFPGSFTIIIMIIRAEEALIIRSILFIFLISFLIEAHQVPSFPGQQDPLQGHHQTDQLQQHAGQSPEQAKFGGEQVKDEGHIKEHLEGKVDPTAHMTPEQLQFHYFNMHDLDKNGRLDGIELIKAITHFHQENPGQQGASVPPPLPTETELEHMIDSILREDDFNGDGYIDYGEFLRAQKHREEQAKQHQQQNPPPPPPPQH